MRAMRVVACLWVGLGALPATGFGGAQATMGQSTPAADAAAAPGSSGVHAAAPQSKKCSVNSMSPTTGETALNKKDYAGAGKIFHDVLAKSPTSEVVHEALVRALLGQDKMDEAAHEADAWAAAEPGNSMALVAEGDVRLRQGDPPGALQQFSKANVADLCNARAFYGLAQIYSLAGYHAVAKRDIELAYRLHPTDDDIHGWWISTRQHKERLALLAEYAEHSDEISDDDRAMLKQRLAKEIQYHTTDCRMAPTSPRDTKVPMAELTDGPSRFIGWGLDVQFNGRHRRLQIDTGASGITISRAAALFLGITRDDQTKMGGIGDKGEVRTSVAHVASIKIGGVEFTNCPVEILEKWSVLDSDGLIGADVFDESLVTLDYPKHELRLAPLPQRPGEKKPDPQANTLGDDEVVAAHDPYIAPEMAQWMRIYRSGHELLMPTGIVDTKRVKDDSAWKDKLFLLDTGAENNLISASAAREVTKVSRDYDTGIRGISGEVDKVFAAGKFTLTFGGLRLNSPNMTAIDLTKLSHDAGVEVSGLIGAPALFQLAMHIDYRDNLVMFEYTPPK